MLDRRQVIVRTGAVAGIAAVPITLPTVARAVTVEAGAVGNPHLPTVLEWIARRMEERKLYFRVEWPFDMVIDLKDPHFKVSPCDTVWDLNEGYVPYEGLAISVSEAGVPIVTEDPLGRWEKGKYWPGRYSWRTGIEKNMSPTGDGMAYCVRHPWMPREDLNRIEKALGRRADYDMRWLDQIKKAQLSHSSSG